MKQNPETESVHLGSSVNLQCSLLSKNKEKRIPCPGERTVHWFRAASGEPHPGYIYSDGHTSAECEERSCVYSLSKTIQNPSDSGTYYCAVVTCGKILFGQGTTIQIKQDPLVLVLGVLLACCVTVIAVLILYIKQRKVYQHNQGAASFSCPLGSDESTVDPSTDRVGEPEAESYVTLRFSTKPAKNKKKKRDPQQECVYSTVRTHHNQNQSAS
ncbi:uncharacterized protein LOC117520681 isoform X2 [Thalassophryne amazonica]|uniref:uncharacterized protein LOC117520681 isoform X2 n=1 Tax=Thalassophryne amazonica TaxID=390379 RepID=UPI001471D45D|nr:uncharacterized protein LOC117520681 isoform X2 [Thalassophryne amazonica]